MDAPPKEPVVVQPQGVWGSILKTTPIVLTVLATALAGMSSSEMTRSMYFRSVAAQQQSKAGDQWSFFQAKRIRGTSLEMTVETLQSLAQPETFDPARVKAGVARLLQRLDAASGAKASGDGEAKESASAAAARVGKAREKLTKLLADDKIQQSLPYLVGGPMPKIEMRTLDKKETQESIDAVVLAIGQRQTERETAPAVAKLSPDDIDEALRLAEQAADNFDKACEPINDTIKQLRSAIGELAAAARPFKTASAAPLAEAAVEVDGLNVGFRAAALDFDARRYRQEAFYNRKAAELYEVRVRRSAVESDRHRERSKNIFYAMLIAQMGVTISSLALARSQRSVLWLLAALAGVTALGFSGYIFLMP